MKFLILVLALGACPRVAVASVPEYGFIAARAADQHGKGAYLIEQDVTFRKDTLAFTVHETWLVANENKMRVTLEGRGSLKGLVQGTVVFDGTQKFFVDGSNQAPRAQRLGEDWLEPLFYFRTGKSLRTHLVNLKVTSIETLRDRPALGVEGPLNYEAPGFIHFARVGGTIAWAIGIPANTSAKPAVWIEQDQFLIRKLRTPNQTVLKADDYAKYDEGLWLPRQRSYKFGGYGIEVQTTQVKSLGTVKGEDARFSSRSLGASQALKLPDTEGLKEFYSRFR